MPQAPGIHPTLPCLSRLRWCKVDNLPNLLACLRDEKHPHYQAALAEHPAHVAQFMRDVAEAAYWELQRYGGVWVSAMDIEEIKEAVWSVYPAMQFTAARDGIYTVLRQQPIETRRAA